MKTLYTSLFLIFGFISVNAQTHTMNWGTSFSPAWAAGNTSSRSTASIGSSGITATVSFTQSEANAIANFGGFTSPQVSSAGSPFNTAIGTNEANLALGMNLSTNSGYVEMAISFSSAVNNIRFVITDIDKNSATSNSYLDEVLITGFNGIVPVTNPTLSKLNGTATNNTTDTVLISGNIARANATNNRGGNTPSNLTDQNGAVRVVFGSQAMTRVVIRYRNASGAQADPGQQAIGIGNISFSNFLSLPVQLLSFRASYRNDIAIIDWATTQEMSTKSFIIEKSENGQSWSVVGELPAAGMSTTIKNYQLKDLNPGAVNLYRIKQIDIDGKVNYSKIVSLTISSKKSGKLAVVPNPVRNHANLVYQSEQKDQIVIAIFNSNGVQVQTTTSTVNAGINSVSLNSVSNLPAGMYSAIVYNSGKVKLGSVQFVKQ